MTDNREELLRRLYRLAGSLRTVREVSHDYDRDLSAALDLCVSETEGITALAAQLQEVAHRGN